MAYFDEFPNTRTYDSDLGWLIKQMKAVIDNVDSQDAKIAAVEQLAQDLKDFVNNYFDNLDVQQEINNKIDVMAEDGTLLEILSDPVEEWTSDYLADWLAQHITPGTTVVIDSSLTVAGAAADSKTVGDRLSLVDTDMLPLDLMIPIREEDFTRGTISNGVPNPNTSTHRAFSVMYHFPYDVSFIPSEEYRAYIWTYTDIQGSNPIGIAWKTSYFTIPKNTYFRLLLAKRTEDSSIPADLHAYYQGFIWSMESNLIDKYNNFRVVPRQNDKIIFSRTLNGQDLTVEVPAIVYIFSPSQASYGNAFITVNANAAVQYVVPSNYVFVFDLSDSTFKSMTQTDFLLSDPKYIILVFWNNRGYPKGQWEIYYKSQISETKWTGLEFIQRQGEIAGNTANSLEGIKAARRLGYDMIRISLVWTADGVPVLSHGATVTIGGTTYTIYQTNYSVIASAVLSLEQALPDIRKLGCTLVLECKDYSLTDAKIQNAIDMVGAAGMLDYVIWASYRIARLTYIRSVKADAHLAYIAHISDDVVADAITLPNGRNKVTLHIYTEDMDTITAVQSIRCHENGVKIKVGGKLAITLADALAWMWAADCVELADVPYPYDAMKIQAMVV